MGDTQSQPTDRPLKGRRSGSGAPKRIASLIFAFTRVKVLRGAWEKEHRRVLRETDKLGPGKEFGLAAFGRWLTFYSLWLACLQVVVEGYDRSKGVPGSVLADPQIDCLLDNEHRGILRRYRNTILHPEVYDHPDNAVVLRQFAAFADWAASLTDEFGRLLREQLK